VALKPFRSLSIGSQDITNNPEGWAAARHQDEDIGITVILAHQEFIVVAGAGAYLNGPDISTLLESVDAAIPEFVQHLGNSCFTTGAFYMDTPAGIVVLRDETVAVRALVSHGSELTLKPYGGGEAYLVPL
jgi:hypothetical protein